MRPLSLRASNLRTFPTVDLQIPEGITAIVGPNGAGKSTLLGAIELALFADGSRDLAPALGPFAERMEITLEFEHDGETYQVRRGYGKNKATLDLEKRIGVMHHSVDNAKLWHPITRESTRETQALIEETLGLSRATFNVSAFLAQGDSANFPEASPADRKAILGAILDPRGEWPKRAERANAERKAAEATLAGTQARIDERAEVAATEHERDVLVSDRAIEHGMAESQLTMAESSYEQAQTAVAANIAAEERYSAAQAAAETARREAIRAQQALADARQAEAQATEARPRLAALTEKAARIPELECEQEAQRTAIAERREDEQRKQAAEETAKQKRAAVSTIHMTRRDLERRHAELLERITDLEGSHASGQRCHVCEQIMGGEARAAALKNLGQDEAALAREVAAKRKEENDAERAAGAATAEAEGLTVIELPPMIDIKDPLENARAALTAAARLQAELAALTETAAKAPALQAEAENAERATFTADATLELARAAMADPVLLERTLEAARVTRAHRRVDLDEAAAALTRAQTALEAARQAAAQLADLRGEARITQAALDTLRLAERAFGRDGIPALIAENTCGVIEAEANRVLEQLPTASGTTFRVELRTQRALKSSDALRETLDILVSDRQTIREFGTFSGGERFRVSFALRWALAKLLAGRRGAESRLLVIDEPDGLDAGGMDGLAAVLRANAGVFSSVLLVSHNPLLASAFEQVLEVRSDGDVSRLFGVNQ